VGQVLYLKMFFHIYHSFGLPIGGVMLKVSPEGSIT
jgi:hypothetical protein